MIILLGLGNPGKKYENTRHNAGFMALDEFAKGNYFPAFKLSKKFSSLTSERLLNSRKVILAKPQTFMNNSGQTAKILNTKYRIQNTDLLVIHDDLDLTLGGIKISKNRGAAGHKGVVSIIKSLKTKDFIRFRIGIKNEELRMQDRMKNTEEFVLGKFNAKEKKIIKEAVQKTVSAIEMYLKEGLEKTMSEYNH